MKKYMTVLLLTFVFYLPCQAEESFYLYTTIKQSNTSEQIKNAIDFYIRPIDFSAVNPLDMGYNNKEQWESESKNIPKEFIDAFPDLVKKDDIKNKNITVVDKDKIIKNGIIANVEVKNIIRLSAVRGVFTGEGKVRFICNIKLIDAESDRELFAGAVNITSHESKKKALPMWGGYRGFDYHLTTTAYNVAYVLTNIIINGHINPAAR